MKLYELQSVHDKGFQFWNSWRASNKRRSIDLRDINQAKMHFGRFNLEQAKFNNSKLISANFCNAELNHSSFANCVLVESYFKYSRLNDANFNSSDLRKAQFNNAIGRNCLFRDANLFRAKFTDSNFSYAEMIKTDLRNSDFENAILEHTNFYTANLRNANFRNADLRGASFMLANLTEADFTGANLEGANLQGAQLIGANFTDANISKSEVYGTSVWQVNLTNCKQEDLIVTRQSRFNRNRNPEAIITVDNLQVAQFVYLLIHNPNIRNILDTITSKVVLILGRFTPDRLAILDALRTELRKYNYLPVLFDFDNTDNRDITETVSTLAHLSRFVIADLTDPKSIPHELSHIVPNLPSVPVIPIIKRGQKEYSMFEHFQRYPWVLDIHEYENHKDLISNLQNVVIDPAEKKVEEQKKK